MSNVEHLLGGTPTISEYADLCDIPSDVPCRTMILSGQLYIEPLTDPDDLADYYEAMREEEFERDE